MNYKEKLLAFLDHPWQEDKEIEFINLIEEYRERLLKATDGAVKYYIKRLWEGNRGQLLDLVSDQFVYEFCLLIN